MVSAPSDPTLPAPQVDSALAVRYEELCQIRGCKPNSQVRMLLNSAAGNHATGISAVPSSTPHEAGLTTSWIPLTVDLSQNIIGSKGIVPLLTTFAQVLDSPRQSSSLLAAEEGRRRFFLSSLVLRGNFLSNEDIHVLCDGIESLHRTSDVAAGQSCGSLRHLDVRDNPISQPGGKRLHQLVVRVPSLSSLLLEQTLINVGLQARIQRILDMRRRNSEDRKGVVPHQQQSSEVATPVSDEEGGCGSRKEGTALVAPPARFRALHTLFTSLLSVCDDPASPTHLTTSVHEPLALLMRSSRQMHAAAVADPSFDITDPMHLVCTPTSRNHDGATFPSRAIVDMEGEVPAGTIGHWLLAKLNRTDASPSRVVPGHSNIRYLASPFGNLHLMFSLPLGPFGGVELLMHSAVMHNFSRAGVASSEFPTLGVLRATSATMLRDSERAGLHLLLGAAFGDPLPLFTEMRTPCATPVVDRRGKTASISSAYDAENARSPRVIGLPRIIQNTGISEDQRVAPNQGCLTVTEVAALSSMMSDSSLVSSAMDIADRKSRSSVSLREEQIQQLLRPTPLGPLSALMLLCEEESLAEGVEAPLLLLRPALAVLTASSIPLPHPDDDHRTMARTTAIG